MKIFLEEIPDEGSLDIEFCEEEEALNRLFRDRLEEVFYFSSPAKGSFHISKSGKTVFIALQIEGSLRARCSRCLAEFLYPIKSSSRLTLSPPEENIPEPISEEDAEKTYFDGEKLDIDEILREEIFLLIPYKPLCKKDCKGLCSVCGQNLNEGQCKCGKERFDERFAALKDFKIKK